MKDKAWWQWLEDEIGPAPNPTVFDEQPVNTGLVDEEGRPIMRGSDPIGFLRFRQK